MSLQNIEYVFKLEFTFISHTHITQIFHTKYPIRNCIFLQVSFGIYLKYSVVLLGLLVTKVFTIIMITYSKVKIILHAIQQHKAEMHKTVISISFYFYFNSKKHIMGYPSIFKTTGFGPCCIKVICNNERNRLDNFPWTLVRGDHNERFLITRVCGINMKEYIKITIYIRSDI